MPDIQEVYEMVTKQKPPEPGALERQQKRQVRGARSQKFGAFVVAAVIGVVAIALALVMDRPAGEGTIPANVSATADPAQLLAIDAAWGFLTSFGAFDARNAMKPVAPDADLTGLIDTQLPTTTGGLARMLSMLEAQGYSETITSCDAAPSGHDVTVVCPFLFHDIRSDEIGKGPFSGSDFTFTVRDGQIVQGSLNWDTKKFSPQMWEPFAEWVSTTYPNDAAVMYTDSTLTDFRLTEESIRLWGERTREYVKEVQATQGQ